MNNVLIVSGYSGSGKSYVLKYLEALGYYCVDNLPMPLMNSFLEMFDQNTYNKLFTHIAIGVDIRSSIDFKDCQHRKSELEQKGYVVKLLFLMADKSTLIHRFQETRSIHPLSLGKSGNNISGRLSLDEAIDKEISLTEPLRRISDLVLDTSNTNVHELKRKITDIFSFHDRKSDSDFMLRVISFGFSKGLPVDLDLLFDVRFLPNPHFFPDLRTMTGKDQPVKEFLESKTELTVFWNKLVDLLDFLTPQYIKEGKAYLTIGIGCTGGRHRSVMFAEKVKDHFLEKGYLCVAEHRDIYLPHY